MNNIELKSFNWLQNYLMSSKIIIPDFDIINYFKKFSFTINYLYRGIGLIRQRIDKREKEIFNNLLVGDFLPELLYGKLGFSSYTKKQSIAKIYSEGTLSLIIEIVPNEESIFLDLELFSKYLIKNNIDYFDIETIIYMKNDKEVLIIESELDIPPKIVYIKGNL